MSEGSVAARKIAMTERTPGWVRYPSLALATVVGVPLTRVLGLFGKWPRMLAAGHGDFSRPGRFTPGAQDVLVCSYFKSGTNWTMQAAIQVAHRGAARFGHIHELVPWLEMEPERNMTVPVDDDSVWRDCPTGLRVIKTHVSFDQLVYTPEAKYIWVVRDPKDVFVSSYHFVKAVIAGPMMCSPAQWLDIFLSPHTAGGSWARHAAGGWANRDRDNVLFLTYEQMKADLPAAVSRIAELMAVPLDEAQFADVVAQSDFAHMRAIGEKFDPASAPWCTGEGAMLRRGERGSAGELLDEAQKRRIDDYWREELRRLGSDFPYDDHYAAA